MSWDWLLCNEKCAVFISSWLPFTHASWQCPRHALWSSCATGYHVGWLPVGYQTVEMSAASSLDRSRTLCSNNWQLFDTFLLQCLRYRFWVKKTHLGGRQPEFNAMSMKGRKESDLLSPGFGNLSSPAQERLLDPNKYAHSPACLPSRGKSTQSQSQSSY